MSWPKFGSFLVRNPVITKDVRTRMRSFRSFILITIHLGILLLAIAIAFLIFQSTLTTSGNLEQRRIFGKTIFGLLVWMELVMVSFVAPALTSGAISSERERQTYDLLRVTLLSPSELVLGKFLPGLGFVFLLLFTSIPLQGPSFLIGGVLWQEILIATLILLVTAVAFCALGLLLSTLIHRTIISTTIAYAIAIFLVFGIPIIALIMFVLFGATVPNGFDQISRQSESLILSLGWLLLSITPLGAIIGTEAFFLDQQQLILIQISLRGQIVYHAPSPWISYSFIYFLFSILAIWLSTILVSRSDP